MVEPTFADEYEVGDGTPREAASRPPVGRSETVSIAGRRWLVGMRWRSYEASPRLADLAEEADAMRADWIARRSGTEAIQVGFCPALHDRWPNGVFSLAALLADSHRVPWAGAFDLGNGLWWYIAVRDNYGMMPDGDVVGTYEEIQWARQEHASLEDFNHVNGSAVELEQLIVHATGVKTRRTPIESLTAPRLSSQTKLTMTAVLLGALLAMGGYAYYRHVQEQTQLMLRQQQARARALKAQIDSMPNVGKVLRAQPDPAVWLEACHEAVYSQPLWLRGWQLVGEHCTAAQFVASWARGPEATIAYTPPGVVSVDGNSISQAIALPLATGVQGSDSAVHLQEARLRMILWGQQHNILITFSGGLTPPPPSAIDRALGSTPPPPVASLNVSFSVPAAPFALDFSGLPGLRLTDLVQSDTTTRTTDHVGDWKFSGVLYGR